MEFQKNAYPTRRLQNILPRKDKLRLLQKPVKTFKSLNICLFTNLNGKPLRFYLNWDEAYLCEPVEEIETIRDTIEVYGGLVARTFLEMKQDNFCIPLLIKKGVESAGVVRTFSLHNQRDLFDSSFVADCVQKQKLMDLNCYRLKDYCCKEYDANQVLLQNVKWEEAFDEIEVVGHSDACAGVMQFDAFYYDVKRLGHDWFDLDISRIGTFSELDKYRETLINSNEALQPDATPYDERCERGDIKVPIRKTLQNSAGAERNSMKVYFRPMYKYIRQYIMKAVYEVGTQTGVRTLGNKRSLWKKVCRHIMFEHEKLDQLDVKYGIKMCELESKWVGIQKHFYTYLLKNYDKYYNADCAEFLYFQKWNKE